MNANQGAMRTTMVVGVVGLLVMAACAGGTDVDTAASTSSSTTTSSSVAASGGATTASTGGSGGAGGAGGMGNCADISCVEPCPGATWPEVDNCPSCACASQLEMVMDSVARPTQHVSLMVNATELIGGIDRWVFDFLWQYDDPMASDDAEDVAISVRLMRLSPAVEPALANATYRYPDDSGNPLEVMQGTYTLYGFGVFSQGIDPVSGFFSIRRVGNMFQGHVYLNTNGLGMGPNSVHVAGPFQAQVPGT